MVLFLQIVGGFFVALVLAGLALYWGLKWKLRSLGADLKQALQELVSAAGQCGIPPMRIHLQPARNLDWQNPDALRAADEALRAAGFERIGDFQAESTCMVKIRAYANTAEFAYAVVYETDGIGTWIDLFTMYQDGRTCTFTTSAPSGLDYPEHKIIRNLPEATASECVSAFLAERPSGEKRPCPPNEFVELFEAEYASEMDWRAERGGPTKEEVIRSAQAMGADEELGDEFIEAIQEAWRNHFNEFWQDEFRDHLCRSGQFDAPSWQDVSDRIVFVHDRMTPNQLVDLFEPLVYELQDDGDLEEAGDDGEWDDGDEWDNDDDVFDEIDTKLAELRAAIDGTPREAFAKLNATLPEQLHFVHHGECQEPFPADAWIMPPASVLDD